VLVDAFVAAMDSYQVMGRKLFQDEAAMQRFNSLLVDYVYGRVNGGEVIEANPAGAS